MIPILVSMILHHPVGHHGSAACEGYEKADDFFGSLDGDTEMLCCNLSSHRLHSYRSTTLRYEIAGGQFRVDWRSISGLRSSFSRPASLGSSNRIVARFTYRSSNVFCRSMPALLSSESKVTSMSRALFMPLGVIRPVFE